MLDTENSEDFIRASLLLFDLGWCDETQVCGQAVQAAAEAA